MKPYKSLLGCTRFLPALQGSEVITFQLYSNNDFKRVQLKMQDSVKWIESISYYEEVPEDTPEVYSTKCSLPFISYSIRFNDSDVVKLKELLKELFPKREYIEIDN